MSFCFAAITSLSMCSVDHRQLDPTPDRQMCICLGSIVDRLNFHQPRQTLVYPQLHQSCAGLHTRHAYCILPLLLRSPRPKDLSHSAMGACKSDGSDLENMIRPRTFCNRLSRCVVCECVIQKVDDILQDGAMFSKQWTRTFLTELDILLNWVGHTCCRSVTQPLH